MGPLESIDHEHGLAWAEELLRDHDRKFTIVRSAKSLAACGGGGADDADSAGRVRRHAGFGVFVAESQANRRFTTLLIGLFAIVAVALAAIGIYGVIAYSTAQRIQEIGIRMALGARRADILTMVLGSSQTITGKVVSISYYGRNKSLPGGGLDQPLAAAT